jgi:uncharacterized protein (TIGR00725 family)
VPFQVAVCGPRHCTEQDRANAFLIGQLLAQQDIVVLCGGGVGVMAAVAEGARSKNGLVIGIRPDADPEGASSDLSAVIFTNMGEARNAALVWSADAVISVGGSWGTLSEVALAKRRGGIPVVCLDGWRLHDHQGNPIDGIDYASTAEEAVAMALSAHQAEGR